jgi:RNA polymerase sigma-70 factor, ECF subfamily
MQGISQYWPLAQGAGSLPLEAKNVAVADADLVRDVLAGSEPAFRELVRRYERPTIALINRLIGDPSRAEELAQDTFVKAFQRLETYDTARRFSSWLLSIAHHSAVDELRRGRIRTEQLDEALPGHVQALGSTDDTPAVAAERSALRQALGAAIRQLRPEYAELVALRYEQEFTLEEIAEATGLPVGTVKSSLHRARTELASLLRTGGWRT